jgi:hypothetical protein
MSDYTATHVCRHCGDPVVEVAPDEWAHVSARGREGAPRSGSILYRCQHTVPYGQNAEPGAPL